jgi:polyisoprenoid-binding protein YceI
MILRQLSLLALLALGGALPGVAGQLECDPARSRIEVVVTATVDSFTGRLEHYEPSITFGPDGHITGARVGFHFLDVHTGKEKRDRAMHEWQQTKEFPDGEFVLDTLTPGAGGVSVARGRLTLHGRTQVLEFPVTLTTQGDVCAIDGDAVVDTREFNLPVIRMLGLLKVDPLVHVRFHLQGHRSDAS